MTIIEHKSYFSKYNLCALKIWLFSIPFKFLLCNSKKVYKLNNLHPNTIIQKNLLTRALKASKVKIFASKVSFPLFLFIGHRRIKAVKF